MDHDDKNNSKYSCTKNDQHSGGSCGIHQLEDIIKPQMLLLRDSSLNMMKASIRKGGLSFNELCMNVNKTLLWQFFYEDAKVRQWKIYVYNETGGLWSTLLTWGRVPFTRHICAKLWLYHDWFSKKKPTIISFLKMMCSIIVKTLLPFTHGCFVSSLVKIGL